MANSKETPENFADRADELLAQAYGKVMRKVAAK